MWFQQIYVLSIALAAACSAAFGDMFLKMSADRTPDVLGALRHPVMGYRCLVLLLENLLLIYAYQKGASFILVNICQVLGYFIATLCIGVTVFNERVATLKTLGLVLSLLGFILCAIAEGTSEQQPQLSVSAIRSLV